MTNGLRRGSLRSWLTATVVGMLLLAIGAAGGIVWSQRRGAVSVRPTESTSAKSATPGGGGHAGHGQGAPSKEGARPVVGDDESVEVSISPDAAKRAGIRLAEVRSQGIRSAITLPGTVTSNAYRETKINALVAGIAREIGVELGAEVRRGQPLAVMFSSELADAQMKYLSLRAMSQADNLKLERTRRLIEIGAASRQELEEVTALATARGTEVVAAGQRLQLLGLPTAQVERLTDASQIVSEVVVTAPGDGVVITRGVNPGQVLQAGQELFVVADLSSVWVIGDVYEKDFARVRAGMHATVTVVGTPQMRGRVAYIDPRVDAATRTAKVRVEVPNTTRALRLGMFAQVALEGMDARTGLIVPRQAVQAIGERNVVYVATDEEGRFVERTVHLGTTSDGNVEILQGLRAGERVVTEGSFFLRAEAARARNAG